MHLIGLTSYLSLSSVVVIAITIILFFLIRSFSTAKSVLICSCFDFVASKL